MMPYSTAVITSKVIGIVSIRRAMNFNRGGMSSESPVVGGWMWGISPLIYAIERDKVHSGGTPIRMVPIG